MTLTTSNKMSVPISAMFGDEKDSIVVKVDGCKPTVVADLNQLAAGSTILTLESEDSEGLGYCLYVNITSHMRKVYREEHQGMITRGNTNQDGELQTYATKYQICLHSCLMFENTLPIRVSTRSSLADSSSKWFALVRFLREKKFRSMISSLMRG